MSPVPLESGQKYGLSLAVTGLVRADDISAGSYEVADGGTGGG